MDSQPQRRDLGAFDIACVVVGGIIGVGIFFTPGTVAQRTASPGEMLLVWVLGGVLAALGAMVFAELSTRAPGHGGTLRYIQSAFGPLPAFLYGWANWLVIQSGAFGVIGILFVKHAVLGLRGEGVALDPDLEVALAAALMLLFTGANLLGLRVGKRVQNALIVAKVAMIVLLAASAAFVAERVPATTAAVAVDSSVLGRFAGAILPVLFAFGGWQQGSFLAGAARRPARDVPMGILLGTAVVIVVYLAINVAYLRLLGFGHMAGTKTVGADAAAVLRGESGGRWFGAMVALSAAGIMNTICMAPPYVLYAMAQEGLFLRSFGRLSRVRQVPVVGVLAQGLWGVLLLVAVHLVASRLGRDTAQSLDFLCDGVVFVDWIFFTLCGFALLALRRRGTAAPFAVPGGSAVAILFALGALLVTFGSLYAKAAPSLVGGGIVVLGLPVYAWFRRTRAL